VSKFEKTSGILPRVGGPSAADFDVFWVRAGRQVSRDRPWTAFWRVLFQKLKALRPFQKVFCCSPVWSFATVD
jgi:hypothetical protein